MKVRLNVQTPIRVGGREQQINKLEYVRSGPNLHAVSPRKLAVLLAGKSERAITDWSNEVLTKGQNADLTVFLRDEGLLTPEAVGGISRYDVRCEQGKMNEFHPHARDARGRLFIPGTAIKGAIRAAVMWSLVDEGMADEYMEEKEREADSRRRRLNKDKLGGDLNQRVLQNYRLPQAGGTAAHRDLLRAVKVSDAYGELESRVEKIIIQSYSEYRGKRTTTSGASKTIFVECLTLGSSATFDLKVDGKILENFRGENEGIPFGDEASLLELVRNFYAEVWGFERRYYGVEESGEGATEAEVPSGPPSFEEWVTQKYGQMSKTKRRQYRGEYNRTFNLFETEDPLGEPREPEKSGSDSGVEDGEVKVGRVRDFYSSAPSPGFRLGWGSGLMSTTVDMRLNEENIGKVLNVIIDKPHWEARPMDGPKSRKLVESEGKPRWPMGWSGLEVVE